MPRYSEKYYLQKDIYGAFVASSLDAGVFSKEALNWLYLNQALKEQQYLSSRIPVPKSNWASNVLPLLSNTRFQMATRMDRSSFEYICQRIQDDPIFQN